MLYLRGISTKDFEPALAEFFGSEAGLSASTIQRLTREWSQELAALKRRQLSQADYAYLWADGVHFTIRLEEDRLCCLVLLGVRADGHKELVAVGDGFRKSTESWADVLRDLKRRRRRSPASALAYRARGFWGALREVFPETREQRCWVRKIANVLDAMPTSPRPKTKAALHTIMNAESKEAAALRLTRERACRVSPNKLDFRANKRVARQRPAVRREKARARLRRGGPDDRVVHATSTQLGFSQTAKYRQVTVRTQAPGLVGEGLQQDTESHARPQRAGRRKTSQHRVGLHQRVRRQAPHVAQRCRRLPVERTPVHERRGDHARLRGQPRRGNARSSSTSRRRSS